MAPSPMRKYFPLIEHRLGKGTLARERAFFDFIGKLVFANVVVSGVEKLAQQRKEEEQSGLEKTVNIYFARHLSEFDWHEIPRILGAHNMMPLVQAGDNLFFGPFDPWLRHLGGFKVIREEARIFSYDTLSNMFYSIMDQLGISLKQPETITKELSYNIYAAYLEHIIIHESRDILIFPEYYKHEETRTKKYGRSYSGMLLPFTPVIPRLLKAIQQKSGKKIQYVPVNVSYERVVEDQNFHWLNMLKAQKSTKPLTYVWDYLFNYGHRLFQQPGSVTVSFGNPIPVDGKASTKLRIKVGALQAIYPTQLLAYAWGNGDSRSREELRNRVQYQRNDLAKIHANLGPVEGMSSNDIIHAAYEQFNQNWSRRILRYKNHTFELPKDQEKVFYQYRNHIFHFQEQQMMEFMRVQFPHLMG